MKQVVLDYIQRIGKSIMLPIAIMPVAGLLLGISTAFTSPTMLSVGNLNEFIGEGSFFYSCMLVCRNAGEIIFNNLGILFAVGIALGMAKKEKGVACLSAVVAFLVMHTTICAMLLIHGVILDDFTIAPGVVPQMITSVCGITSLEMGTFGGIIVGIGVAFLHNRFYRIKLPDIFLFFGGTRFVPIISTIVYIFVGVLMFYVWPIFQTFILNLGEFIVDTGYVGTFIYGALHRLMIPFGIHHLFYLPFWQTAVGGSLVVQDVLVQGGQNIFFAQMADPNLTHFSVIGTRYFTGQFLFMIFGLPGACVAMYQCADKENKKKTKSLLISASLTSIITGITEPIEFSFIFSAPILFAVHALLAGSAYMICHILDITIGFTFSGGFIDFFLFGILQGQAKTYWLYMLPLGVLYFVLYYVIFKCLILKFNLKTIGRNGTVVQKELQSVTIDKGAEETTSIEVPVVMKIIQGLGGIHNILDIDCCVTRLRITTNDLNRVDVNLLKMTGAAGVVKNGTMVQVIYGPRASLIKADLEEYIERNKKVNAFFEKREPTFIELYCICDGLVRDLIVSQDEAFSSRMVGDGVVILPKSDTIKAPCKGVVKTIFATKHAIIIQVDENIDVLVHIGVDTSSLQGHGMEVMVKVDDPVDRDTVLWKLDLEYIKANTISNEITVMIMKRKVKVSLIKFYGDKMQGELIGYIEKEGKNV